MTNDRYERKEYTTAQIAYLAGIVDGEGCLHIGNYSRNKKTGAVHYQTCLQISNTEKGLIDWICTVFGGRGTEYTRKQHAINCTKKVYKYEATGSRLTHICELILPYSTIKKRQIEIMLAVRDTYKPLSKKGQQGVRGLNDEVLALRLSLMLELRDIHCRKGSLFN